MKPLKNCHGFTMIELMIAMFVTALSIAGYIGTNIALQRSSEERHERTVAIQDASRTIEQMRNAAQNGTFPGNVVATFPNNGIVAGFNSLLNEQVTVSYADTAANPLDATVTVAWMSYTQRQNTATLRTYLTQR
jgi:prepilin-type N-terminal cleavage/methylation domain-containing protein